MRSATVSPKGFPSVRTHPRALPRRVQALAFVPPRKALKVPGRLAACARAMQRASAPARPPSEPGACCVDVTNILLGGSKWTTTVWSVVSVNAHAPKPEHAPPQPPNPTFAPGAAVNDTEAPLAITAVPSAFKTVPPGLIVTEPAPAPAKSTVTTYVAFVNV